MSAGQLSQEVHLQARVTVSVRRQRVSDFLSELQRQSGLRLTIGTPPAPGNEFVTAYLTQMTLADVMAALMQTHSVEWRKEGERSFSLHADSRPPIPLLGDLDRESLLPRSAEGEMLRSSLVKDVLAEGDLKSLWSPQGLPITALSPGVRARLREYKESAAALRLIELYRAAMDLGSDDNILRFDVSGRMMTTAQGPERQPLMITIRTAKGVLLAPVVSLPLVRIEGAPAPAAGPAQPQPAARVPVVN